MTGNTPPRLIEGKHALLAVLAISVAGAGGGWWYQRSLQRRPLELWGGDAARLMLYASEAAFCELKPAPDGSPSTIAIAGLHYAASDCQEVTLRPGFVHLRRSLLSDYSFDWSTPGDRAKPWRSMLRFRQEGQTARVVFSDDFRFAMLVETGASACVRPIASGIAAVLRPTK